MDDNIGNILYIIITLVALAVGLLGKKKKKPSQGSPDTEENTSGPGFLENLERALNNLSGNESEVVDLRRDEPDLAAEDTGQYLSGEEAESELTTERSDYDPFGDYLAAKEQEASERSLMYEEITHQDPDPIMESEADGNGSDEEPLEVIELDQEDGVDYFDVVKNFNLGTAVVYSAIINRIDY